MLACRGFTYLTALFVIAFMGVGSMAAGTVWHTASLREKEAELLFVGNAYRQAIERYVLAVPQRRYPRTLEELVKDPRQPATQRYIRQLYSDPITSSNDWGIVKAPDGGVMGVYSRSELEPVKKTNFKLVYRDFEAAKTYADWKFIYTPAAAKPAAGKPAASAPVPTPAVPSPASPAAK